MKKAVLYHNPAAGRTPLPPDRLTWLLARLRAIGYDAVPVTADFPEGIGATLELEGVDLLLIHGGDGTIHSLLPTVVRWQVPIALLPSGTANVLARELGVPRSAEKALDVLSEGKTKTMYLGQSADRYFHLMAGVGLDSYVIRQTGERLKKLLGIGAFWIAGIRSYWSFPLIPFEIVLDGVRHEATFAVISNSRFYGGHLLITPRASVFEKSLDVCLFRSTSRFRYLGYLAGVLRGRHVDDVDVVYRKVSSVQVLSGESVPVQMDGEVVGCSPMDFGVCSRGIEIFVP